jgi:hypothetical protein
VHRSYYIAQVQSVPQASLCKTKRCEVGPSAAGQGDRLTDGQPHDNRLCSSARSNSVAVRLPVQCTTTMRSIAAPIGSCSHHKVECPSWSEIVHYTALVRGKQRGRRDRVDAAASSLDREELGHSPRCLI